MSETIHEFEMPTRLYNAVLNGEPTASQAATEYAPGDKCLIHEFDANTDQLTGRKIEATIKRVDKREDVQLIRFVFGSAPAPVGKFDKKQLFNTDPARARAIEAIRKKCPDFKVSDRMARGVAK